MDQAMDETSIKALVEPILKAHLDDFGFEDVHVRSGEDFEGDPVLFIDTRFEPGTRILDGERILSIIGEVRHSLYEKGEMRFPHLRWHYSAGDYPEDAFADATAGS
jgi:hypothetical protein